MGPAGQYGCSSPWLRFNSTVTPVNLFQLFFLLFIQTDHLKNRLSEQSVLVTELWKFMIIFLSQSLTPECFTFFSHTQQIRP